MISSEIFIQDNLRKIKSKGKVYTNLLKEINMKEIFGKTNIMEKVIIVIGDCKTFFSLIEYTFRIIGT